MKKIFLTVLVLASLATSAFSYNDSPWNPHYNADGSITINIKGGELTMGETTAHYRIRITTWGITYPDGTTQYTAALDTAALSALYGLLAGTQTWSGLNYFNNMVTISSSIKIINGSPGVGKVLTSDAEGIGNWESASGGGDAYLANDQTFTGYNSFSQDVSISSQITMGLDTKIDMSNNPIENISGITGSSATITLTYNSKIILSGTGLQEFDAQNGSVKCYDLQASDIGSVEFDSLTAGQSITMTTNPTINPFLNMNGGYISNMGTMTFIEGYLNMGNRYIQNIDWPNSDDGSGSELDADMLDGKHYDSLVSTEADVAYLSSTQTFTGINTFNKYAAFNSSIGVNGYLDMNNNEIINSTTIAFSTNSLSVVNAKYYFDNLPNVHVIISTVIAQTTSATYEELGLRHLELIVSPFTNIIGFGVNAYNSTKDATLEFEVRRSTSSDYSNETVIKYMVMFLTTVGTFVDRYINTFDEFSISDIGKIYYYRVVWRTDIGTITSFASDEPAARFMTHTHYPNQYPVIEYEE